MQRLHQAEAHEPQKIKELEKDLESTKGRLAAEQVRNTKLQAYATSQTEECDALRRIIYGDESDDMNAEDAAHGH